MRNEDNRTMASEAYVHEFIMVLIFVIPLSLITCMFGCGWVTAYCQHRAMEATYREAVWDHERRNRDHRRGNGNNDHDKAREERIRKALAVKTLDPLLESLMEEQTCLICLSGYKLGETFCSANVDDCVHLFHEDCLLEWLMKHDDCPCCRRCIIPEEVAEDRIELYHLRTQDVVQDRVERHRTSTRGPRSVEQSRDYPPSMSHWLNNAGTQESRRNISIFSTRRVVEERV